MAVNQYRSTNSPEEHWRNNVAELRDSLAVHFEARSPCYIVEGCGRANIAAEQIRRMVQDHGVQCVAVDYAQLLTSAGKNRYEQVTATSQQLRHIANETGVLLIVLCQLSRAIESRTKFVPQLSDLKESGQLEQDSDVVLFLVWPHRINPSTNPKEFQVWIGKNRNRAINQNLIECRFEPSRQRIREVSVWDQALPVKC